MKKGFDKSKRTINLSIVQNICVWSFFLFSCLIIFLCCCLFVSLQSSIIYWKATAAHLGRSFPNLVYCVAAAILVIYRSDKSLRSLLFTISPLSPFSKTNIADTLQQPNILPTLCYKKPEKESNTSLWLCQGAVCKKYVPRQSVITVANCWC